MNELKEALGEKARIVNLRWGERSSLEISGIDRGTLGDSKLRKKGAVRRGEKGITWFSAETNGLGREEESLFSEEKICDKEKKRGKGISDVKRGARRESRGHDKGGGGKFLTERQKEKKKCKASTRGEEPERPEKKELTRTKREPDGRTGREGTRKRSRRNGG